jgi:hypothetical protein
MDKNQLIETSKPCSKQVRWVSRKVPPEEGERGLVLELSFTPWLQPGEHTALDFRNRFNGFLDQLSVSIHRAKATV